MRKFLIIAALSFITFGVSAQSKMDIEIPAITAVEVSGNIVLRLTQGDNNTLKGDLQDDMSKDFTWQIQNGNTLLLKLSKPTFSSKSETNSIVLHLTFSELNSINATNGSSVINSDTLNIPYLLINTDGQAGVSLDVNSKAVIAKSSNKGRITLMGNCNLLVAKARYSSSITAEKLKSKVANVDSSVNSEVYVNALEILTTTTSSNGNIYYKKGTDIVIPLSNNPKNVTAY